MVVFLLYHFNHQNTRYAPDLLFLHLYFLLVLTVTVHLFLKAIIELTTI